MNFINPIGRTIGDNVKVQACMCNSSSDFASAKSTSDSCNHCGCSCSEDGAYRTGNRVHSLQTWRAS